MTTHDPHAHESTAAPEHEPEHAEHDATPQEAAFEEQRAEPLDVAARAKREVERARHGVEQAAADLAEQADEVRARATGYVEQARDALTDEQGRPNRTGWIALSIAAVALGGVLVALLRGGRR